MKAADIPDFDMLIAVHSENLRVDGPASVWNVAESRFQRYPPKVVLAKVKKLIKRRLLDGCSCGCRGDLCMTEDAARLIGTPLYLSEPYNRWERVNEESPPS